MLLFRIVIDEDVVPGVPPFSNYSFRFRSINRWFAPFRFHTVLINPSYYEEKKFIQKPKSSVKGHLPKTYMKGLSYVKYTFSSHQDLEYIVSFNNSSNHNSSSSSSNSKDNTNTNNNKYNKSSSSSVLMVNEVNETTRVPVQLLVHNLQISQQTSDMVVGGIRISLVVEFSKRNFNNNDNNSYMMTMKRII